MRTFAISDTNDLVLGHNGRITIVTDLQAALACCKTAMQAQLGEMQYEMDKGIPYFDAAFNQFNPAQFEAAARLRLLEATGVTTVQEFNITRVDNTMIYRATIQTIYGTGEISNG